MALKDNLVDLLDGIDNPTLRWGVVAVGIVILLRLRLVLFAAALPVMAYWHFSQSGGEGGQGGREDGNAEQRKDDRRWQQGGGGDGDEEYDDDEDMMNEEDMDRDDDRQRFAAGGKKDDNGLDFGFDDEPADLGDILKGDDAMPNLGRMGGGGGMGGGSKGGGGGRSFLDGGDDDDLIGSLGKIGGGGGGSGGGGGFGDFDFLGGGGGGGDDFDFLGGNFGGGGGKGKGGKGKGKKGDKGDKGGGKSDQPREPNPKQIFCAGVGDLPEEEIRSFFEDVGEICRLKVLTNPDGSSKGVCFVTFQTEEEAQRALELHGMSLDGRTLTVSLAHGGNPKGKTGEGKGGGKADNGFRDRPPRGGMGGGGGRDRDPLDLGGSDRFGAAFGFGGDGGERRGFGGDGGDRRSTGGKGKSKKGGGKLERGELDGLLEDALADVEGPLRLGDFDFAARRFLAELRSRDRVEGSERFNEALEMVFKYTSTKDRSSVRKWPAYIFTLLQKFDPNLWEELRERDAERRQAKGGGFGGKGGRGHMSDSD